MVFPPPRRGAFVPVLFFLEGSSHGTVLVAALAEEVPAAVAVGPAAHIDARSIGRSRGSRFPAPGHAPGRCRPSRGHGGGLQPRRQGGSRGRQRGTIFYLPSPEQRECAAG